MTRKLTKPYIAMLLLLCLALVSSVVGAFAIGNAKAETTGEGGDASSATTVTLSDVADFEINDSNKLLGLSEDGAAKVENADYYEVVIPASVVGFVAGGTNPIKGGYSNYNTKLVKVSFAQGSECTQLYIGRSGRFFEYCSALKEVDLSNATKLTTTKYAFHYCPSLEKVTFPDEMYDGAALEIGASTFYNTGLKEFTIPAYVNSIASNAIWGGTQFETVKIAEGNETFVNYTDAEGNPYDMAVYTKDEDGNPAAFVMAPYTMETITLPMSMVTTDEENEDISGKLAYLSSIGGLKTVVVPENDEVYAYGNALWFKKSVTITEEDYSYTILAHDSAFIPSGIVELGIPKGCCVEWIDESEIWDSEDAPYLWFELYETYKYPNLKTINVEEGNTVYNSYSGVLYNPDYDKMFIPQSIEELTIPKEIENFDFSALSNCAKLKSVSAEEDHPTYASGFGVLYSADYSEMVYLPKNLEELTIPKEVTNFDFSALSKCPNIKSVDVEEGNDQYASRFGVIYSADYSEVLQIPQGMEELTIPKEASNIDFSFLSKYPNLKKVNVEEGNTAYISRFDVIYNADYSKVIYIPHDMEELTIPKELTNFDSLALANCRNLKSVVIEEGNTSYISRDGIIYNSDLTELIFVPSTLTEYYVPATLEKIGEYVFAAYDGDGNRTSNRIEKVYVTDIEKWAQIQFGDPIETAEQYEQSPNGAASRARREAVINGLEKGYGPNPLSGGAQLYVRDGSRWVPLEELVLDFDGQISDMAFVGCTTLLNVTITDKVTRIGEMSFAGCTNLRNLTVPYIGVTKEFKLLYTAKTPSPYDGYDYHGAATTYLYELFGGRGSNIWIDDTFNNYGSGSRGYFLAPTMMESVTVTGYNIWTEYDFTTGVVEEIEGNKDYHYGFAWNTLQDTPANKVTISIDNDAPDGHDIEGQWGILYDSLAKVVDLKNSKISKAADGMFAGANIEEITTPETLEEIPSYFFSNAKNLKKVTFPEGVKYLGIIVFTGTENLFAVTFPSTIEGFWGGYGDKSALRTVYLTGSNQSDKYKYTQYLHDGEKLIYVAADSEIYKGLPDGFLHQDYYSGDDAFFKHVFYLADVEFVLKDANGNILATKTEKHLAAARHDGATLKYGAVASPSGDYWDIVDSYDLPEVIGRYKVDNTKWTLDGNAVTADTRLVGDKPTYVITQQLEADAAIPIVPMSAQKVYDGKAWTPYEGITITQYRCTDGGHGYTSSSNKAPVDAGTYIVTARCAAGYVWGDADVNSSATRTFTLQITPAAATLVWKYMFDGDQTATDVTGTVPSRVYNGIETRGSMYAEFKDISGVVRTVNSSALSLYAAGDRETNAKLTNVGLYEFVVYQGTNTADGAVWLGNYTFENGVQQFRITPYVIDLSDYDNLAWGLDGYNSYLLDRDLYIYDGVPYAYEQADKGNVTMLSVKGSVARLRKLGENDNLTIVIANIPAALSGEGKQYTATYVSGNKAKDVGIYIAEATLTAIDGNYEFTYGLGIDLLSRGISITINDDGSATITKTWYVVAIDNGMLNSDGSEYVINGWTFGNGTAIAAPRLEHGDEATDWMSNNNVTFELLLDGESLVKDFKRSAFADYINPSMPAGRYELVCTVHNVTVNNHVHWWDNEEHNSDADNDIIYHGFTHTFVFDVEKAEIEFNLIKGNGGYADYEWEYNAENKANAFVNFEGMLNANVVKLVSVQPSGYWATNANKYYGGYTLTYNFAKMNNEYYLSTNSNDLLKNINGVDTYTVYFQITAPNHSNLTDTHVDGRYAYYFTVTVYSVVEVPEVIDDGLVYTGNKVLPEIVESELYETIWDANDMYVAGGQHSVSFRLYDNVHYRWLNSTADTVSVNFTIAKADNAWIRVPNIVDWTFETFDAEVNRIRAVVKFLDNGQSIMFAITKADGTAVAGLGNFSVNPDGIVDDAALINALNGLKVGAYKLVVTVYGTNNYKALSESVDFTIGQAINTWADGEDELVLPSWIVGQFSLEDNPIVVKAAHGEAIIQIRNRDNPDDVYYDSRKPEENTLNELEVGKYNLVAWVPESENYSMLYERTFTIEVLKKIGLPWWGTTLVAVGALGLAAAVLLILWKLKVFEILTDKISLAITTRATVDATIAAVRATKRAEEAEAHKRKVEAAERLQAAREAYRNKTPEERAQALQEKAEATATRADEMHAKASKMRARADKLAGNNEQSQETTEQTDDTSTEE